MSQEWSHVGIRLDGLLRADLEKLAEAEDASISDLVRRAVQIYVSGGPEQWEKQQQTEIGRRARSNQQYILPPEVQIHGQWLLDLPDSARTFVMQAGRAIGSMESVQRACTRWYDFLKLSPFLMWYAEAHPPIPIDLPEQEQFRRIAQNMRIVECNDSFARINGYETGTDLTNLHLKEVYAEGSKGIYEMTIQLIRSGYRLADWLLTADPVEGPQQRSIAHVVGQVEGGYLTGLWGITQSLDPFDGELRPKKTGDGEVQA